MEHPEERTSQELTPQEGLSPQELESQDAAALPDREAMSTISLDLSGIDNFAMPINEAVAINNQSIQSTAYASASQTVILGQTDVEPGDGS